MPKMMEPQDFGNSQTNKDREPSKLEQVEDKENYECPYCERTIDLTKAEVDYSSGTPHMIGRRENGELDFLICGDKLCDKFGWSKEEMREDIQRNVFGE